MGARRAESNQLSRKDDAGADSACARGPSVLVRMQPCTNPGVVRDAGAREGSLEVKPRVQDRCGQGEDRPCRGSKSGGGTSVVGIGRKRDLQASPRGLTSA